MTKHLHLINTVVMAVMILLVMGAVPPGSWGKQVTILSPDGPAEVSVEGNQLVVKKRLADGSLDVPRPFVIKGVTWSPATRAPIEGPNPLDPNVQVPYGFFFDWPGRQPQGHELFNFWLKSQFKENYQKDVSLMKLMNVNTVRVYSDFGEDPKVYQPILDEFYRQDIMIILTVANTRDEMESQRYLEVVNLYKNHSAILMWSLGNEWNLNRYYSSYLIYVVKC